MSGANLERICRERVKTGYRIDVIDVLEQIRKVVGDMSSAERRLFALRLGLIDV